MKGFKNAQEAILVISVVLIVAVSVAMTYVYLQAIPIPGKFENHLTGDTKYISSEFAKYIVACHHSHKSSKDIKEDCYVLHIRAEDTLSIVDVLDKIPVTLIPHEQIIFSGIKTYLAKKNTRTTFKITYDGPESRLRITRMDEII